MYHIKHLLFLIFIFHFHIAGGQYASASKSLSPAQKFICLKPIAKKVQLTLDTDDANVQNHLTYYITKNNTQADTLRPEFHHLILGLLDEAIKNQLHLSIEAYNSAINNYNNICQIIDYLREVNIPPPFLKISEDFYRQQIRNREKLFRFNDVVYSYHKYYKASKLIKTGNQLFKENEAIVSTSHNQLEKILEPINHHFSSLSIKKQITYQRHVQMINPWIESFRKGITYNDTRETFIVDDDLLLLIPE